MSELTRQSCIAAALILVLWLIYRLVEGNNRKLRDRQASDDDFAHRVMRSTSVGRAVPEFILYARPFWIRGIREYAPDLDMFSGGWSGGLMGSSYEERLLATLRRFGRVVCLSLGTEEIGAGRVFASDEEWEQAFVDLAQSARWIAIVPGLGGGVLRELEILTAGKLIHRTVLFGVQTTLIDGPDAARVEAELRQLEVNLGAGIVGTLRRGGISWINPVSRQRRSAPSAARMNVERAVADLLQLDTL